MCIFPLGYIPFHSPHSFPPVPPPPLRLPLPPEWGWGWGGGVEREVGEVGVGRWGEREREEGGGRRSEGRRRK